ncbi:MAG: beta-ketoacyl synthase chain length factor [Saprospiraceae bacterium]|nr:beta-ketoacyl synthase chain length factor [Saprospiraceae bacterium]
MPAYINSIGNISPQHSLDNNLFLEEIVDQYGSHLTCKEPNYRDYIAGANLRRMSRVIKLGVSAAKICLEEAQVDNPDAIIVGTGLGCMEDTDKFLSAIYESNEEIISPTQFIQSTHNSVASQIAIMLGCNNYNFTYVHRGFSFESALFDALLQFAEDESVKNILLGGIDEITPNYLSITGRLRQWKPNEYSQLSLLANHLRGSLPGEGAAFFMLGSEQGPHTYAQLQAVGMRYKPADESDITRFITQFLAGQDLDIQDIDLVLLGLNGNTELDKVYYRVRDLLFKHNHLGYFKHLCGEYKTATAFGMWLAAQILHKQRVPEVVKLEPFQAKKINNVLIYNNYSNINHSLLLLRNV